MDQNLQIGEEGAVDEAGISNRSPWEGYRSYTKEKPQKMKGSEEKNNAISVTRIRNPHLSNMICEIFLSHVSNRMPAWIYLIGKYQDGRSLKRNAS